MGKHAEMLFDAGLAGVGFTREAVNVREWRGQRWTRSGNNLDRVYVRDGMAWGAEIKNRLRYIERGEMLTKIAMCEHLGLRPLFIGRMFPSSYIKIVEQRGGFVLVFKYQFYPYGHEELAGRVQRRLELPVGDQLAERTVRRFLEEGHKKRLGAAGPRV